MPDLYLRNMILLEVRKLPTSVIDSSANAGRIETNRPSLGDPQVDRYRKAK